METEALIRRLVAEARPVKPVAHPLASFGVWAAVALIWIAAAVTLVGPRTDLAVAARAPEFALNLVLPLAVGLAASMAALFASVPGHHRHQWTLIAAAAVAAWLLLVIGGAVSADHGRLGAGARCIRNLAAFSLPPGLLLYHLLRRAAPLDRGTVGMLATLATSALAQAGTRLVCHNDGALHVLVWHASFVVVLGALGIPLARALFSAHQR